MMVYVGVINKEGDTVKLNLTTMRSWSAVVTDALYGVLAAAIFAALIPALVERGALDRVESLLIGVLFAVLTGCHLGTAAINALWMIQKNRATN